MVKIDIHQIQSSFQIHAVNLSSRWHAGGATWSYYRNLSWSREGAEK